MDLTKNSHGREDVKLSLGCGPIHGPYLIKAHVLRLFSKQCTFGKEIFIFYKNSLFRLNPKSLATTVGFIVAGEPRNRPSKF